jgi:molybdopterin-guanine dinucleotide biosynthesis protein A
VPRVSGWIEPLHGLYAKRCRGSIEELIRSGIYQIFRFFSSVSVRFVEDEEIRRFDPDMRSFLNVNTPDELRRAEHPHALQGPGARDHASRRSSAGSGAGPDRMNRG